MNGGDLPAFDEAEFNTVHKKYRVITRAFADLCNPEAGYAPETAQNSIELKKANIMITAYISMRQDIL